MASNSPECRYLQIMVLIAVPGLNQNALRIGESSSSEYYGFILSRDGPRHSIMSKWICVDASYTENIPICAKTLKSDVYLAPTRRGLPIAHSFQLEALEACNLGRWVFSGGMNIDLT